jgi:heat shock protein HslJ
MPPTARSLSTMLLLAASACGRGTPPEGAPSTSEAGSANLLVGYTWTLTRLGGQPAGIGADGRQVTLRFAASGVATGFAGCSGYRVTYTVEGDSLRFKQPSVPDQACSEGMSLQRNFLLALPRTRAWRLTDRHLELLGPDETLLADLDRR